MLKIYVKYVLLWGLLLASGLLPAQQLPDSIRVKLDQLPDQKKIEYLGDLSWRLREPDRASSILYGKMAVDMANQLGYPAEEARYANFLGAALLFYNSNPPEALYYFNRAYEIAMHNRDSVQLGYAYNNIGDVYSLLGNIPLAQAYADSSLSYFNKLNDPQGLAYSYLNLGQVKSQKKEYDDGLSNYQKAIDLYPLHQSQNIVSTANIGMARIYVALKDYAKALAYYRRDLELTSQMGNKTFQATTLANIANVQMEQNEFDEALATYNQSLQLFDERGYIYGTISVHLGKALVYAKTNKQKEGEQELDLAETIAENLALPSQILEVQKTHLRFYDILGKRPDSGNLIDEFIANYDSIFLVQQFQVLTEIQQKQKIAINLQQVNNEYQQQKQQFFYMLLLSVMFAILLLVYFWKSHTHAQLNKKLKSINAGKDKLLSIISHDLKTPFVSIIQFLEILESDDFPESEKKKFIKHLHLMTHNTYTLLENLLNFSAFRTNVLKLRPELFDLPELVAQIGSNLEALLTKKEITLQTELQVQELYADKKLIEVVLRNLISNAVKYSTEQSSVTIKSSPGKKEVLLEVIDSGTGMTEDVKSQLFADDFSDSRPGTHGEMGTGIGLKICREFISIHKGKLSVESAPGQGTCFRIQLPLKK